MNEPHLPSVGSIAPSFTATLVEQQTEGEGRVVSSEEWLGKPWVLVFYPKDNTPGCTLQACALRDNWKEIKDQAMVFGVSPDHEASHKKFIQKYQLPYPLLVDTDKVIAQAFGVWVEKSMFGKKYMANERTTFIVDANGKIASILRKVAPLTHLAQLKKALKNLNR
jgi:thioredoxin-dependent peroxiredoxin